MPETHQIRMAKASQHDVSKVMSFLRELEEKTDDYECSDNDLGKWVNRNFHEIHGKYERILLGFSTLVDNVCDPNIDYLDCTPELKRKKLEVIYLRQLVCGELTMADVDIDKMFEDWLKDNPLNV